MNSIVDTINAIAGALVSALAWPLHGAAPVWGLVFVSAVCGVIFLLIYGKFSNQNAIKQVKRRIHGHILEAILFRNSPIVSLKAQAQALRLACWYLCLALPPILVLFIPCVAILTQLDARYASRALRVGEAAIIELWLSDNSLLNDVRIEATPGINITPPVRINENNEVAWRIDSLQAGIHTLNINVPSRGIKIARDVAVEVRPEKLWTALYASWWERFFYPGDLNLSKSAQGIDALSIQYPAANLKLLGISVNWLVLFVVVSMLSGIVASKIFKVSI